MNFTKIVKVTHKHFSKNLKVNKSEESFKKVVTSCYVSNITLEDASILVELLGFNYDDYGHIEDSEESLFIKLSETIQCIEDYEVDSLIALSLIFSSLPNAGINEFIRFCICLGFEPKLAYNIDKIGKEKFSN